MNCIYCHNELSERANFCPKCKNQTRCLSCGEELEQNSEICIVCGNDVKQKDIQYNTIEFKESKKGRSFKTTFTNEVGNSIAEAFGVVLVNKGINNLKQKKISSHIPEKPESLIEETDSEEIVDTEYTELHKNSKRSENDKVYDIFNDDGNDITLSETRLKAASKKEYGIRLATIFLYYKFLKGVNKVNRNDLNSIMDDASLYDGNFRSWLSNNNLIGIHEDYVDLKLPGREKAKEYINEIYNPSLSDGWVLGSITKKRKRKESEIEREIGEDENVTEKNNSRKKATTKDSYNIVKTLNLKGNSSTISLEKFCEDKIYNSSIKFNVLAVYYLQKVLILDNITLDHVYSCYKDMKVPPPTRLLQSLRDTSSSKYGYLDTSNIKNITIPVTGENYVEYELVKKNKK